ncbi:MAG TPA: hypothetical protein VGM66_13030 [Candidatus Udaeobacter sp.]|jgi:16S rRNA G966 N2-methylase RsmD
MNRLYFGDNLKWLRDTREFPDASVDLVYLDPPFIDPLRFVKQSALNGDQTLRHNRYARHLLRR